MLVAIGSTNSAKVMGVQEVLSKSKRFSQAQLISVKTSSGVSDQPLSLSETTQGAKNRAEAAFKHSPQCLLGFGIESGLMEAPDTSSGYLLVSVCSIFNGSHHAIGLSTGFEIPPSLLELMLNHKKDLTQACLETGISKNAHIGSQEGLVGILTHNQIDRKEYSKQAVLTALAQYEFPDWYFLPELTIKR